MTELSRDFINYLIAKGVIDTAYQSPVDLVARAIKRGWVHPAPPHAPIEWDENDQPILPPDEPTSTTENVP